MTAGPDLAGYKKAITDLEKQHGQNRARVTASNTDDKDAQLDALDTQLEQSKATLADTYGISSKDEARSDSAPINTWIGGDPDRLQFVKEAHSYGKLSSLMENPTRMNTAFKLWYQQEMKRKNADQAAITADRLRDAYRAMQ